MKVTSKMSEYRDVTALSRCLKQTRAPEQTTELPGKTCVSLFVDDART